jgi:hypothetical protein
LEKEIVASAMQIFWCGNVCSWRVSETCYAYYCVPLFCRPDERRYRITFHNEGTVQLSNKHLAYNRGGSGSDTWVSFVLRGLLL